MATGSVGPGHSPWWGGEDDWFEEEEETPDMLLHSGSATPDSEEQGFDISDLSEETAHVVDEYDCRDFLEEGDFGKAVSYLVKESPERAIALLKEIRDVSKDETVKTALDRILLYIPAFETLPEKEIPSFQDRLKIACLIEDRFLHKKEEAKSTEYVSMSVSGAPRAFVLNHTNKQFLVLSKEYGTLYKEGVEHKVSLATHFTSQDDEVVTKRYARIVNISSEDAKRMQDEIERFGDIHNDKFLHIDHVTKSGKVKVSLFEELYETDAYASRALTPQEIRTVLKEIVHTVSKLHSKGYIHRDIKPSNIMLNLEGEFKAKLGDWGKVWGKSDPAFPQGEEPGYGATGSSAPETFTLTKPLVDAFEEGKAEDLFAIGCVLYHLLTPNQELLPWESAVTRAVGTSKENEKSEYTRHAIEDYENGIQELRELTKKEQDPEKKPLFEITLALLEADPRKRMTLAALQAEAAGE